MRIGIIDADLLNNRRHRFPNLACMKISGYYEGLGHETELLMSYDNLDKFDKVFISKVFSKTPVPDEVLKLKNVEYGGTGFFYDKAPRLPEEIEHHFPNYDLYLKWVNEQMEQGKKRNEFQYYLDYSIGFTTRGCFRKCEFCVNKNYNRVERHSPVKEFLDKNRKYICLLDDNVFGYKDWHKIFEELKETGKPFQYKQGLDERLLDDERCVALANSKYKGDYIFAFDNINDKDIIEKKLAILRGYTDKRAMFYLFCAFDRKDKWDKDFWRNDIIDIFERLLILNKHGDCLPYLMRFERYEESPHRGIYLALSQWCNQPSFYRTVTFREYCVLKGISGSKYKEYKNDPQKYLRDGNNKGATWRYLDEFVKDNSDIADKYFDIKFPRKIN